MTSVPNGKPTEGNQENPIDASRDEALIKKVEVAIYSAEIWRKAVDVLCKRIASREVSDEMLLRIVISLSKSNSFVS
jgi:hypothetical protein